MTVDRFDVVGVGNAMVDIIAACDVSFLAKHGLERESVRLIDAELSAKIQGELGQARRLAAGSCVNTLVGVRSLGGRSAFIGLPGADELGVLFERDLATTHVAFTRIARNVAGASSHNIILVTPDGRRTIASFLGTSAALEPDDLDPELIASGRILFLEGYLLDGEVTRRTTARAMEIAKSAGRMVAMSLSHRAVVSRHRAEIRGLLRQGVDVLFGNESEITALYQTTHFSEAAHLAANEASIVALTRGRRGSYVLTKDRVAHAQGRQCERIVDITGAGDLFAAGFLMALSERNCIDLAARLGNAASSAIIQQYGARPEKSLADLARARGLITGARPVYSEDELFG